MYRLRVVVEEVKGFCDLPMNVGDYFEIDGGRLVLPQGKHVCIWALQAMMPLLTVKQREVNEPNDWAPNTSRIVCPDPNGLVIYRIDRIGQTTGTAGANGTPEAFEDSSTHGASGSNGGTPQVEPTTDGTDSEADEGIPQRLLVSLRTAPDAAVANLCSFAHEQVYDPHIARIQVHKDEAPGLDTPTVCRQCVTARCVAACPPGALSRDPVTHAVLFDPQKCMRCGLCKSACPFGAIRVGPGGYPLVCDLCGGDPQCVKACPTQAVRFGRAGDAKAPPRFEQPGKLPPKNPGKGLADELPAGGDSQ